MTKSAELYACLYAKDFPAQSLLRLRPELHSKPCVVIEGEPPSQYVCSLNTKARLAGLVRGMTRVEVDTFSEPIVLSRSVQAETATRSILLECAGAFSPRIEDHRKIQLCSAASTSRAPGVCSVLLNCWRKASSSVLGRSVYLRESSSATTFM